MSARDSPVLVYFALAYAISWACWSPLVLAELGVLDGEPSQAWHFAGAFGPLLAAGALTAWLDDVPGLRALGRRLLRWRATWRWWVFALGFAPAFFLIAAAAERIVTGDWLDFGQFGRVAEFPELPWYAGAALWFLTFGLGEEVGWRGFALPRLQSGRSAMSASYILGAGWALWHLPAFAYNYEFSAFMLIGFAIGIMAGAVLLTSLFNGTGGSLLLCVLWHGSYNATVSDADPAVSMLVTAGVIAWAMFAGRRFGPETLAPPRQPRVTQPASA